MTNITNDLNKSQETDQQETQANAPADMQTTADSITPIEPQTKLFYITNSTVVPKPIGVVKDPLALQGLGNVDMRDFGWDGQQSGWLYDLKSNPGIFSPMWVYGDIACTKPLFLVGTATSNCYIRVKIGQGWDHYGHYTYNYLY